MPLEGYQRLPSRWEDREKLRDKGQFWTPDWVARPMVRYAVGSGVDTLFDPAAGNGAFLKALQSLGASCPRTNFYGMDTDASLLEASAYRGRYCRVETRDFLWEPPTRSFDSIVANPPYVRHHRLSPALKGKLRAIAVENIGCPLDGRAGLHVYFLVRALTLLARGGRLAFIVPADICEGLFARKLWEWITSRFCLDAVVTFAPDATPFPGVDTNALVLMIRNTPAQERIHWIRCTKAYSPDLLPLVESDFRTRSPATLEIKRRSLTEAVNTGLSRPPTTVRSRFTLSDFARIMRGVATGANDFFWITRDKAAQLGIPDELLKPAIGRTRDVPGDTITGRDLRILDRANRPTLLFSPDGRPLDQFPRRVREYLRQGEKLGLMDKALIKTRNPWYKMERRAIPPFLFAYLGRRNTRFIRNEAGVIPLTGFLCVYPTACARDRMDDLWEILRSRQTTDNLVLVGKSYGSGAIKVEPRGLERLPIPDGLVAKLGFYPQKTVPGWRRPRKKGKGTD